MSVITALSFYFVGILLANANGQNLLNSGQFANTALNSLLSHSLTSGQVMQSTSNLATMGSHLTGNYLHGIQGNQGYGGQPVYVVPAVGNIGVQGQGLQNVVAYRPAEYSRGYRKKSRPSASLGGNIAGLGAGISLE